MIIHRNDMKVELKEKMRDGEGTATLTRFVDDNTQKNARLLGELSLPPGASIGYHQHTGETEYFIFLSGTGIANDNGVEIPVTSGDMMATGNGAFHSIKNTGQVPLVFHALIVTYQA